MKVESPSHYGKISGSRIAKNTLWNILGQGLPLLVGLGAIPFLIHDLGIERFGVLTIAWMVIGYFSIFDFGLGRALTKLTAEKLGAGNTDEIPELVWTALMLMGVLGILGGLVIAGMSQWLVYSVLNVPIQLREETLHAFYLLALSIPLVIGTIGMRGVLEAYQRFGMVNLVRIPLGIWTFIGPVIAIQFSNTLYSVVLMLVVGRIAALVAHIGLCFYAVPILKNEIVINRHLISPLARFGGWMTVSNIVGPLMVYMDRFLIGAIISMSAVAYYTTPYEIVTKLWMIPVGLVGVLFPVFSSIFMNNKAAAASLFNSGTKYIFIVMFPLMLVISTFAFEGLELWLGTEFAVNGYVVLQWLAAGLFINSLARVPFAIIQSAGRPDTLAITHLLELPVYLFFLWWSLERYGVNGAATVWAIRVIVDTIIIFVIARWLLPESAHVFRSNIYYVILALVAFEVTSLVEIWTLKVMLIGIGLSAFGGYAWISLLNEKERYAIKKVIRI